jgi:hypothetical protein
MKFAKPPWRAAPPQEPDVLLDVSRLHVDDIDLKLDSLDAHVALKAEILDFVRLDIGVDAALRGVALEIEGVDAQALLKVRLENLAAIVDRVLTTVDRHPEVLERLVGGVATAVEDVADGAATVVSDVGHGAGAALGWEAAPPRAIGRSDRSIARASRAARRGMVRLARARARAAGPPSRGAGR